MPALHSFFFVTCLLSVPVMASTSFTIRSLFTTLVEPRADPLKKVQPIPANPCVQACEGDGADTDDCMQCCRTVHHEVDWKCQEDGSTMFKTSAANCCIGEWNPECWDTPSADNFFHACASCCGSCSNSFNGCGDCGNTEGGCECGGCDENGKCNSENEGEWTLGQVMAVFICVLILTVLCVCFVLVGVPLLVCRYLKLQKQLKQSDATTKAVQLH